MCITYSLCFEYRSSKNVNKVLGYYILVLFWAKIWQYYNTNNLSGSSSKTIG